MSHSILKRLSQTKLLVFGLKKLYLTAATSAQKVLRMSRLRFASRLWNAPTRLTFFSATNRPVQHIHIRSTQTINAPLNQEHQSFRSGTTHIHPIRIIRQFFPNRFVPITKNFSFPFTPLPLVGASHSKQDSAPITHTSGLKTESPIHPSWKAPANTGKSSKLDRTYERRNQSLNFDQQTSKLNLETPLTAPTNSARLPLTHVSTKTYVPAHKKRSITKRYISSKTSNPARRNSRLTTFSRPSVREPSESDLKGHLDLKSRSIRLLKRAPSYNQGRADDPQTPSRSIRVNGSQIQASGRYTPVLRYHKNKPQNNELKPANRPLEPNLNTDLMTELQSPSVAHAHKRLLPHSLSSREQFPSNNLAHNEDLKARSRYMNSESMVELDPRAVRQALEQIPAPDLADIADKLDSHFRRRADLDRERDGD